jgi:hypothetical protein
MLMAATSSDRYGFQIDALNGVVKRNCALIVETLKRSPPPRRLESASADAAHRRRPAVVCMRQLLQPLQQGAALRQECRASRLATEAASPQMESIRHRLCISRWHRWLLQLPSLTSIDILSTFHM